MYIVGCRDIYILKYICVAYINMKIVFGLRNGNTHSLLCCICCVYVLAILHFVLVFVAGVAYNIMFFLYVCVGEAYVMELSERARERGVCAYECVNHVCLFQLSWGGKKCV